MRPSAAAVVPVLFTVKSFAQTEDFVLKHTNPSLLTILIPNTYSVLSSRSSCLIVTTFSAAVGVPVTRLKSLIPPIVDSAAMSDFL